MKIPLTEIANLVEYSWTSEVKHHAECSEGHPHGKHIFDDLHVIRRWLIESGIITEDKYEASAPQNWKDFTKHIVTLYCTETQSTIFTLQNLQKEKAIEIQSFSEKNKHPFDKVRQQLQLLRQDGILSFIDNKGTYELMKQQ